MALVDFDNDAVRRFVIRRYAYDPSRRQRRHMVVVVVDSRREFNKLFKQHSRELQQRRDAGEVVDPRDHVTGHVMEPGHLARARNGHLLRRAVEHGVCPDRLLSLELPRNIGVLRAEKA